MAGRALATLWGGVLLAVSQSDVELLVDAELRLIHVRSASRVGHSDLGANRRRVEALRAAFDRTDAPA